MITVAIASTDNVHVNQHFGWCEKFFIYEVDKSGYSLIREADASQKHEDEIEKLVYKIESLGQSDIVYVTQIGPKAANMVKKVGIYPMRSSQENETIEAVLNSIHKMVTGNAPLWLKRIILQKERG
jgi:nitrogen fixation protein NifX